MLNTYRTNLIIPVSCAARNITWSLAGKVTGKDQMLVIVGTNKYSSPISGSAPTQNYRIDWGSSAVSCPHCFATGLIQCGRCQNLTCESAVLSQDGLEGLPEKLISWLSGNGANMRKKFCCPSCGNRGFLTSAAIQDLRGKQK